MVSSLLRVRLSTLLHNDDEAERRMAPAASPGSRRGASPPSGYRYVNQQHYYTSLQQALHPGQPVPQPYSLANTRESFRDLLAFEERLKQNAARLAYQRRKYEGALNHVVVPGILHVGLPGTSMAADALDIRVTAGNGQHPPRISERR